VSGSVSHQHFLHVRQGVEVVRAPSRTASLAVVIHEQDAGCVLRAVVIDYVPEQAADRRLFNSMMRGLPYRVLECFI